MMKNSQILITKHIKKMGFNNLRYVNIDQSFSTFLFDALLIAKFNFPSLPNKLIEY